MKKNCGNCKWWDQESKERISDDDTYVAKCLWKLEDDDWYELPDSLMDHHFFTSHMDENDGSNCPTFQERK